MFLGFSYLLIAASLTDAFMGGTKGYESNNLCRDLDNQRVRYFQMNHPPSSLSSLAQPIDEPVAWNAVIGEADRAFRRGTQLDKSGQPRLASDAFHEAATLFQCFLELPENFGHVTNLSKEDCEVSLAYTLVRLGFISVEALSDANAAVRLYT